LELKDNEYLLKKTYSKVKYFSKQWFSSLWKGERPLWEAWWVLGISTYILMNLLYFIPIYFFQLSPSYYYSLVPISALLQFFLWISIWKCASNVINKAWFYIARIMVLVGIINYVGQFVK